MEDILASIRRILNEDETPAGATPPAPAVASSAAPPPPPAPVPPPVPVPAAPAAAPAPVRAAPPPLEEEPLDLTEDMLLDPPPIMAPLPEPPRAAAPPSEALLAPAAAAAATASVGHLLRTVAQERSSAVHRGGPTIEDVVRDEVRPLLKEWLDLHLPPMVERLVRVEIERVVGRDMA